MAGKRNTAALGKPATIEEMVRSVNDAIGVRPDPRWDLMPLDLLGQRARDMEIIKLLGEILECLKSSR